MNQPRVEWIARIPMSFALYFGGRPFPGLKFFNRFPFRRARRASPRLATSTLGQSRIQHSWRKDGMGAWIFWIALSHKESGRQVLAHTFLPPYLLVGLYQEQTRSNNRGLRVGLKSWVPQKAGEVDVWNHDVLGTIRLHAAQDMAAPA